MSEIVAIQSNGLFRLGQRHNNGEVTFDVTGSDKRFESADAALKYYDETHDALNKEGWVIFALLSLALLIASTIAYFVFRGMFDDGFWLVLAAIVGIPILLTAGCAIYTHPRIAQLRNQ